MSRVRSSPALRIRLRGVLVVAGVVSAVVVPLAAAQASVPAPYTNCTTLHKVYPHGIGTSTARDHTSGKPVTNFRHDTTGYTKAIRANAGLDRDKDHVACEQA